MHSVHKYVHVADNRVKEREEGTVAKVKKKDELLVKEHRSCSILQSSFSKRRKGRHQYGNDEDDDDFSMDCLEAYGEGLRAVVAR